MSIKPFWLELYSAMNYEMMTLVIYLNLHGVVSFFFYFEKPFYYSRNVSSNWIFILFAYVIEISVGGIRCERARKNETDSIIGSIESKTNIPCSEQWKCIPLNLFGYFFCCICIWILGNEKMLGKYLNQLQLLRYFID